MSNDTGIQIHDKLLKLVSTKFDGQSVLIVTPSKTLRTNIKKVLVMFNFSLDRIGVTDSFYAAKEILTEYKPSIVICSFVIDEEFGSIDLMRLHRENFPSTIDNIFISLTSSPSHYMRTYKYEHKYDEIFKGEQSIQGYANGLQSVFIQKLQVKPRDLIIADIQSCINRKDFSASIDLLSKNEEQLRDVDKFSLLGEIYFNQAHYDKSIEAYELLLEEDPINFKALHDSIKAYYALGNFKQASELQDSFLEHFECVPENLILFLRIYVENKQFTKALNLGQQYTDDVLLTKEDKMSLVELYQEAAKGMLDENPEKAQEAVDAITSTLLLSGGTNFKVFNTAIDILIKTSDFKAKAEELYSKYYSNFSDEKEIDLMEYKAYYASRTHDENFKLGIELFNKNYKSHFLFYTLIITGLEIGRKKDALEDIIYSAIKAFPDFRPNYEALLTKVEQS